MAHLDRRAFLTDLGKGVAAAVVLAACSTDPEAESTTSTLPASPTTEYDWAQVDLGFVSAYVLVRSGEAVLVDTGVSDSEGAIESVLEALGLGWASVGHVIITHEHGDHQGSVRAVLDLATDATGYAAQPDLGNIASPRALIEVTDGEMIAGLQVIASPGHTPGHISVLDPGRILVTGDAINNTDGTLTGPNPQFSADMAVANESARLLASFDYEVALFGHGSPIVEGASAAVGDLAASL